jgi:transcriptional regulator with XRE-family HTH domain
MEPTLKEEDMNRLKQMREAAGITQAELAKRTGISVRVIQNYEQGARPLNGARAITVKHIADALGCRMEDLIEE